MKLVTLVVVLLIAYSLVYLTVQLVLLAWDSVRALSDWIREEE